MLRSRTWPAIAAATLTLTTIAGTAHPAGTVGRPAVALGGGSLLGTVSAAVDGSLIAGVCVAAEANGGWYRTTTDARGRWALTDLPAGPAFLVANDCEDAVAGFATTWWPAAASPEASHAILVERGQLHDGIELALPAAAVVAGRVMDASSRPISGVCVAARDEQGTAFGRARSDADGRYVLPALPAGSHVLEARDCVPPATRTADRTAITVAAGDQRTAPDLRLGSGGSVTGVIVAEHTGLPTNGACVTLWTGDGPVGGSLYRGARTTGLDALGAPLPERGRFLFDGLEPGRYRVLVGFDFCSDQDGYDEVWFGGPPGPAMYEPDAATAVLDVEVGARITGIDVRVRTVPTTSRLCPWPVTSGAVDVGKDQRHRDGIDCLATYGVTAGRGDGTFAPDRPVTRGQVATLLVRTIAVTDSSVLLPSPPHAFDDTRGNVHEEALDQLAALGILRGPAPRTAAPDLAVTRGQLAALLVRAYEVVGGTPLRSDADRFTDDAGHPHEGALDRTATAGLLAGVTTSTVRPDAPVTRGQAATILARFADRLLRDT